LLNDNLWNDIAMNIMYKYISTHDLKLRTSKTNLTSDNHKNSGVEGRDH